MEIISNKFDARGELHKTTGQ